MIPAMLSVGRLRSAARHAPDLALLQAERLLRSRRGSFEFAGRRYPYHSQLYNTTWRNERAVELPIALGFLEGRQGPRARVRQRARPLRPQRARRRGPL